MARPSPLLWSPKGRTQAHWFGLVREWWAAGPLISLVAPCQFPLCHDSPKGSGSPACPSLLPWNQITLDSQPLRPPALEVPAPLGSHSVAAKATYRQPIGSTQWALRGHPGQDGWEGSPPGAGHLLGRRALDPAGVGASCHGVSRCLAEGAEPPSVTMTQPRLQQLPTAPEEAWPDWVTLRSSRSRGPGYPGSSVGGRYCGAAG